VTVDRFALPLERPLATADGEITEREGVLVTVDSGGRRGLGEATPLRGWTESLPHCDEALSELAYADAVGEADGGDHPDPAAALETLPPAARHGVALALLDADAAAAGEPLYRHFGRDDAVESVPVNATVGDGPAEETAADARAAVDAGFPAVKVKVGARSLSADVDRIAAVREACPDVELRADANGAWERPAAERALDAFADHDVAYVEQPLPADDLGGVERLAGGAVGVALDEGLYEHGLDAALDAGVDVLVLKPMAMGGPDLAVEAAVLARGAGVDPVVTTTVDGAVARAAAVHVAAALPDVRPCGLATGDRLAADLLPDPAPVRHGRASVPQKEGNTPDSSPPGYA
jgi:o-succinylbenzoate synthase